MRTSSKSANNTSQSARSQSPTRRARSRSPRRKFKSALQQASSQARQTHPGRERGLQNEPNVRERPAREGAARDHSHGHAERDSWAETPHLAAALSPPLTSDPLGASPELQNPAGTQRAQEAAMVQQVMRAMQFGHRRGQHEARLVLQNGVEVRLSEVDGVLMPTLSGDGDLSRLRSLLEEELLRSGVDFSRVELA